MAEQNECISDLLAAWKDGDRAALDKLVPLIYSELRRLGRQHMARERPGHMLQTTAVVNEAYLRLAGAQGAEVQNRAHFFGIAARLMRQILVDHARVGRRVKRGGGAQRVELEDIPAMAVECPEELLSLDAALTELARTDERKSRVVELRFFAGMDVGETAQALGVSENTVIRDWALAKAWLAKRLRDG